MHHFYFAQKAFIIHEGKLLAVRKSDADPNQPGRWEVPGGRMEFGEEIDAHLLREVKEEVGIDIVPGNPFHIWQWQFERPDAHGGITKNQIVAVARICHAHQVHVSIDGRVADDFLGETQWVSFGDILKLEWIPNMLPVVTHFLRLVEAGSISRNSSSTVA